jgi:SlyX protein
MNPANERNEPNEHVEKRLIELEMKLTLTEDTVERLNEIVVRQQEKIDLLLREVGRLARERGSGDEDQVREVRDEIPPHY